MNCVTGKSPGALRSRFNLRPAPILAPFRRKEGLGFPMDLRGKDQFRLKISLTLVPKM